MLHIQGEMHKDKGDKRILTPSFLLYTKLNIIFQLKTVVVVVVVVT
jgi:hypothetical protein